MTTALAALRAPLFVPATRPERFAKAASSGADAVILDLEDAVAPADKPAARAALRADFTDLPVIVRINPAGTPWHAEDLSAAAAHPFAAVMLPKAESAAAVEAAAAATGLPVLALVETAHGLAAARRIAPAAARMVFGSIDFCADLGCDPLPAVLDAARFELVLAARLAAAPAPWDGVTANLADPGAAAADAAHARAMGMGGKLLIHPRQAAPVRDAFRPSEAQVDWARRVLAAGDGTSQVDGEMVDEPVRLRARAILSAAEG
ncbi:HpcH/HpaI aldolase/citrate lyase family protein [Rhodovulum sp. DZ06]|uniref:HpcH/HpaI aldolase/citrate lyase family protein n=1 Tax=Rhodovulum sp. DZ06 TaxID=3425126 RepID=UPI003D34CCFE